jgi:LmbE family N-acetylglucosaminyl deacetylase
MKIDYGYDSNDITKRKSEIEKVNKEYDFKNFINFQLKPAHLEEYAKSYLISLVSKTFKKIKPDIILLPNREDIHSDHKIVFDTVASCTKSFRYPYIKEILTMEIISETDFSFHNFQPNFFVDVSDYIDRKIDIFNIYKSEIKDDPFPRSENKIKSLANFRGSIAGVKYAEAFKIIRKIEV